jgi:hypothetical protein
MTQTTSSAVAVVGPVDAGSLAELSTEDLMARSARVAEGMAALAGQFVLMVGELDRREGWRMEGATSLEAWIVESCGLSVAAARSYAHVAERMWDLPHLAEALCAGAITFDKVRAVVDVATPETDRELRDQASEHSVSDLVQLARSTQAQRSPASDDVQRRSLKLNDTHRTVTAQLPPEAYNEVKACLVAQARELPSDGETPWDERLCDAFLGLVRGTARGVGKSGGRMPGSPYFVVAHAALADLLEDGAEDGRPSPMAGDLERGGLVRIETLRRIACDATVVLAVDNDVGHTMYEGRARRFPSEAQRRELMRRDRHCRFPSCDSVTFTNAHHLEPWKLGGTTDLYNLALLCEYHHRLVHDRHWTLSGDANGVLTFVAPTGRVLKSPPSPLWTRVSGARR